MPKLSARGLTDLLEVTARMLHSRGHAQDLFPAQWVALRYFDRAPREKCTASELARFQGLANGPVSRTVRTLLLKGLLAKAAVQPRGRAELVELTETGRALLLLDPAIELEQAIDGLGDDDQVALAHALERILRLLSQSRER